MKVILAFAFSQVGIIFLCIFYAVGGAQLYLSMELPAEEEKRMLKKNAALVRQFYS